MVVGSDTFTGDLARRLGWANAFADSDDRYPKVEPAAIEAAGVDLVLLPDEPYVFTAEDGPEAFPAHGDPAGQRPAAHVVRPVAARSPVPRRILTGRTQPVVALAQQEPDRATPSRT